MLSENQSDSFKDYDLMKAIQQSLEQTKKDQDISFQISPHQPDPEEDPINDKMKTYDFEMKDAS